MKVANSSSRSAWFIMSALIDPNLGYISDIAASLAPKTISAHFSRPEPLAEHGRRCLVSLYTFSTPVCTACEKGSVGRHGGILEWTTTGSTSDSPPESFLCMWAERQWIYMINSLRVIDMISGNETKWSNLPQGISRLESLNQCIWNDRKKNDHINYSIFMQKG